MCLPSADATVNFMHWMLVASMVGLAPGFSATLAFGSPTGDACRKKICDSTVAACMRSDQSLNPLCFTAAEKKSCCAAYFDGCMSRYVTPDVPWYSPEVLARFLKCPP